MIGPRHVATSAKIQVGFSPQVQKRNVLNCVDGVSILHNHTAPSKLLHTIRAARNNIRFPELLILLIFVIKGVLPTRRSGYLQSTDDIRVSSDNVV